jgi:hypothetical protein
LCDDCVKEKCKDHKIKSIELLIPDEEELKQLKDSLEEIKKKMEELKLVIDDIVYSLNASKRIYENYCKIANHIITKYETFNKDKEAFKNFTIFKCLRNLKKSNKDILDELKSVVEEKENREKAKKLLGIYNKKKEKYYKNEKETIDLNIENDEDWFKEVCEREKNKEKEKNKEEF